MERLELAGLTTRIVGDGPVTCVLLHGFGAPGDDLVPLADHLAARCVFPEAPLELAGIYGDARAWWLLDLARLELELASGTPRDRRGEVPEGLPAARDHVMRLLDQVQARLGVDDAHLVVGGFSQGAMVALDVALHRERPVAGVVVMSGTLLAESEWRPRMSKLAGVPVLQSHGRRDPLLPFSIAEVLRDQLKAAGADVEWHDFIGGHEIPPVVLDALARFVAART
ncbi:MAG: alpha/beta hydrolase [Acidobacteriota bacterium]